MELNRKEQILQTVEKYMESINIDFSSNTRMRGSKFWIAVDNISPESDTIPKRMNLLIEEQIAKYYKAGFFNNTDKLDLQLEGIQDENCNSEYKGYYLLFFNLNRIR